jgi:hypothetical protein
MLPLYKPFDGRYDSRCIRRCSSMVEHGFRKAGVEGSTPSIGFGFCYEAKSSNQEINHDQIFLSKIHCITANYSRM